MRKIVQKLARVLHLRGGMALSRTPTPHELLRSARAEILRQHEGLRRQFWSAIELADDAIMGDAASAERVGTLLITLVAQLKAHMSFEESVLLPLLRAQGSAGASEAAVLVSEHERQRAEFARLLDGPHELPARALSLQLLVEALLVDMTFEERKLLKSRTEP